MVDQRNREVQTEEDVGQKVQTSLKFSLTYQLI